LHRNRRERIKGSGDGKGGERGEEEKEEEKEGLLVVIV
jgi:hypothetical protein